MIAIIRSSPACQATLEGAITEMQQDSPAISKRWTPPVDTNLPALEGISNDLREAADLFELMVAESVKPLKARNYLAQDAYWSAAVVRYTRSFGSGRRDPLRFEQVSSELTADQRALHSWLKDVRDKHIAHPVNQFQSHDVDIWCTQDPTTGDLTVTGVATSTFSYSGTSIERAMACLQLAKDVQTFVRRQLNAECTRLLPYAQQMSAAALKELPSGPRELNPDPRKARRN